VNEQLLPLLLEDTVGKSSNENLKNINEREQNNQRLSALLVQDQLKLFDEAMKLQLDALTFAAEHFSQWSEADHVVIAMGCRVFNHLRAAAYLVLAGYWAESWHLQRAAYEAMTREVYFYENPGNIGRWLKKKRKEMIRQAGVIKLINSIFGEESGRVHESVYYDFLSELTHPNRRAIELETWSDKEGKSETWNDESKKDEGCIGIRSILGGYIDMKYSPLELHTLMIVASNATTVLKFVGLHGAANTWVERCDKLREAVYGVTTE